MMTKEKKPILKGWDLSNHINPPDSDYKPASSKTVKESYREQVMYDYNMDKL